MSWKQWTFIWLYMPFSTIGWYAFTDDGVAGRLAVSVVAAVACTLGGLSALHGWLK